MAVFVSLNFIVAEVERCFLTNSAILLWLRVQRVLHYLDEMGGNLYNLKYKGPIEFEITISDKSIGNLLVT